MDRCNFQRVTSSVSCVKCAVCKTRSPRHLFCISKMERCTDVLVTPCMPFPGSSTWENTWLLFFWTRANSNPIGNHSVRENFKEYIKKINSDKVGAGIGIYAPRLGVLFSVRLPYYIPIFEGEFFGILLVLHEVPASILKVITLTDFPSVCALLGDGGSGRDSVPYLSYLITSRVENI